MIIVTGVTDVTGFLHSRANFEFPIELKNGVTVVTPVTKI